MFISPPEYPSKFLDDKGFATWFNINALVYHCEFHKAYYDDNLFNKLGIKLSASLEKAVIKRRAEFLVGRYCAKKALQKLGMNNADIEVGVNRNPLWPQSVIGSISHCEGHAVAVISSASSIAGIGIDIECEVNDETFDRIQGQIIFDEEVSFILDNPMEKLFIFTLLFSVKESFFKAAYPIVGEYFGFDAISLVQIDRQKQTLSFRINSTLHDTLIKGMLVNGAFHVLPGNKVVTLVTI